MIKRREYRVFNLISKNDEERLFITYTSEEELEKFKSEDVQPYIDRGYVVDSHLVDKEHYLNAKIDWEVREFCFFDAQEKELKEKALKGDVSVKVLIDTLDLIHAQKETIARVIGMLIRRIIRENYDVFSELAIAIYNHKF